MSSEFTLEELADAVQSWCEKHHLQPANGQAAEQVTERNIRYYRTLGLLDAPMGHYAKTFTEKHRLQLIAIRIYQAQGLPLRKIRDELYGKSLEDLEALEKHVAKRNILPVQLTTPLAIPLPAETWSVTPLAGPFLLVSRQSKSLPGSVLEKINQLLRPFCPEHETTPETSRN